MLVCWRLGLNVPSWVLVDGSQGCGDVLDLLLKMFWIAELVGSSDEGIGYRLTNGWVVEGAVVKISVSVGGFPVDLMCRMAVGLLGDEYVQERDGVVFLDFHGELDVGVLLVDVDEELVEILSVVWPNDESVVDISEPE